MYNKASILQIRYWHKADAFLCLIWDENISRKEKNMKLVKALPIKSPRLLEFVNKIKKPENKESELKKFWKDLEKEGTPIYEELDNEPDYYLVTFIFKEKNSTNELSVASSIFGTFSIVRGRMKRIKGTNIYYKSIFILRKTKVLYSFVKVQDKIHELLAYPADYELNYDRITDPLNPKSIYYYLPFYGVDDTFSYIETPDCLPQEWIVNHGDVPSGTLHKIHIESPEMNKLLKKDSVKETKEGNGYEIEIYLPANYSKEEKYGTVTIFDAEIFYLKEDLINTQTILDNLIHQKKIPPVIGIFFHQRNRHIELVCNKTFGDFITKKVFPELNKQYNLSKDPKTHVIGGASLGGLMSMFMGLEYPEFFGNILCQSGSFWAGKEWIGNAESDDNKGEFLHLIEEFVTKEKVDIKIHMDIGRYEGREGTFGYPSHYWANVHMRNILRSKNYQHKYIETNTDHSILGWRDNFVDGVIYLIGKE